MEKEKISYLPTPGNLTKILRATNPTEGISIKSYGFKKQKLPKHYLYVVIATKNRLTFTFFILSYYSILLESK